MFHQQNNFNTSPLHIPMPMEAMTHSPNQMEQVSPHNPSNMAQDNSSDPFTEVINISKIKDGFFIGDKLAAISIDVIIQFKITHFINATGSQIMNQWESLGINYLTINWSENERQILFDGKDEIAERIVQFIDSSFIVGEGLLAHSYKGQNRVCLVVLIYLMKKYKWSLNKSMDYLKSKNAFVELLSALNEDTKEAIYYTDKEIVPMIKSKESMRFFIDMLVQAFEDLINIKSYRDITLQSYATILNALAIKLPHINESLLEIMRQRNLVNLNINNSLQLDHLIIYITKEKL